MKRKIVSLVLMIACLLCGCAQPSAELASEPVPAEPQMQLRLKFNSVTEEGASTTHFSSEDLNGNYEGDLYYIFLQDVTVELDGTHYALEEAIRDGRITVEALAARAQADARNGFCRESTQTENGLTEFAYDYQGYRLCYINDILETPDGESHRIRNLNIETSSASSSSLGTWLVEGGGPGDYIDKEDWGLTFEVVEAFPDGITLKCTQSGGQQFGELLIWSYGLYRTDKNWYYEAERNSYTQPITMNGTTTFSIDWMDQLYALPLGSYGIRLRVEDIYSAEDVPPLSRNFHDRQIYEVEFTIE